MGLSITIEHQQFSYTVVVEAPQEGLGASSSRPDYKLCVILRLSLHYWLSTFLAALDSIERILMHTDDTVRAGLHSELAQVLPS